MTVQDIVTATATDMRQLLSDQLPDASIIIPWVDRIQKDALHSSLFNYLLHATTTFPVIVGINSYSLIIGAAPGTIVRRILAIYDRTFDRALIPFDKVVQGLGGSAQVPEALVSAETMVQWPCYYMRDGASSAYIFPAPQKSVFGGTYEAHIEIGAPNLLNLTDTLLIPDDGKDLIVAGVNSFTASYLKNGDESQRWAALYEQMKMNGGR